VLCFTWNLGYARPLEEELAHWLPLEGEGFDLVAVGVQECSYGGSHPQTSTPSHQRTKKKRKSLKGCNAVAVPMLAGAAEELMHSFDFSPSRTRNDFSPVPQTRDVSEQTFSFHWDDILAERLGDGFVRVQQVVLMNMRLLVFARVEYCDGSLKWRGGPVVHTVKQTYSATGLLAGTIGNKGGLVVSLHFGPLSLCFVSCHLAAHMHNTEKRNSDCKEILQETWPVCHPCLDLSTQFDHCFWFGDLNYRVDLNGQSPNHENPRLDLKKSLEPGKTKDLEDLISRRKFWELVAHDQLTNHRCAGTAFAGFREGEMTFPPTFKVERIPGTIHVSNRAPSYCDRILWKSLPAHQGRIKQTLLDSVCQVSTSDHKPVLAHFQLTAPHSLGALLERNHKQDYCPAVRLSKVSAHGLTSQGSTPRAHLVFLVAPLELNCEEYSSAVHKKTVNPVWKGADLPLIRPAASTQEQLASCTLFILVYSNNVKLGCVTLGFPGFDPSHSDGSGHRFRFSFEEPLVLHNQTSGTGFLAGNVEVDWSEDAISAANEAARLSELRARHKKCACVMQ